MLKNYLIVAFRSLSKNKHYVIINTVGLGISLACCITAYLLIAFNMEFNSFHKAEKTANIFAVHTHSHERDGRAVIDNTAPNAMAPIALEEIAGIKSYTRYQIGGGALRYKDNAFNQAIAFADSSFFEMFDFPLEKGSHRSFQEKNSIFISETLARKYFGNEDPVGKMMTLKSINEFEIDVIVGGVVKKVPSNTSFYFDAIMRMEHFLSLNKVAADDWGDWRNPSTFFALTSADNAPQVTKSLQKYIPTRNKLRTEMVVESYSLAPFKEVISHDNIRNSSVALALDQIALTVFMAMAGLILLIACFNLTNTSIAMTTKRLKEVGVRKAIGAARRQIVYQFLLETVLTVVLSILVGLTIAQFIVPIFAAMWHLPYGMQDLNGINLVIALTILLFVCALIAGIYPALSSSGFRPTQLLKGNIKINGTNMLTRSLIAFQFALSIVVLVGGVTFIRNAKFQESLEFGYNTNGIITVRTSGEKEYETFASAIAPNSKILSVGIADGNLGTNSYSTPIKSDTSTYDVQALGVGKNYLETMGLKLVAGRYFNLDNQSDQEEGLIVNKAFLTKVGLDDPIEKVIYLHNMKHIIVGVVENHIDNLYRAREVEPFIFYPAGKHQYMNMVVKVDKDNVKDMRQYLEGKWKETFQIIPFESYTQEELVLGDSKSTNSNLQKILIFITVLGGLLSLSGIFALASQNIAKRTKEIGIRKTLGASVGSIINAINKEFLIILVIAAILGSVGGYFLTEMMLGSIYALRIDVGTVPTILCALTIFLMGMLTTCSTIMRAAKSNPVKALRSE
ncbi:ABC transporter permease [Pseudochryseolinea flava]|uniref:ABC transporter permease n=1 Tax=Pseudochryseolinea flava TaxID=2059302 RepID=A0A364XY97_9BACT|nr:FtsX-like permease family protein [Pseudochryseolinea flava]RAV99234.1 hypothetical protein DQQ10_20255 [Pseudochryseolinea flava]